jgi:hypothetical protein
MGRGASLLGRLASPTGFVLVALCFGLPFLTASCKSDEGEPRMRGSLSYTGVDLVVGGRVDWYYEVQTDGGIERIDETDLTHHPFGGSPVEPIAVQPFVVAALVLLGAGVLAGLVRPPGLRRLTTGAVALVAGVFVVGGAVRAAYQMAAQLEPMTHVGIARTREMIMFGSGYWLAVSLLLLLGVGNVAGSLRVPPPGSGGALLPARPDR